MKSLNLKLSSEISNVELPVLNEIQVQVRRIGGTFGRVNMSLLASKDLPFEIISGDMDVYIASSGTDLDISGKTKIENGYIPSSSHYFILDFREKTIFRMITNPDTDTYVLEISAYQTDGGSMLHLIDYAKLPWNKLGVIKAGLMDYQWNYEVDISDLYDVDAEFCQLQRSGQFPYVFGTLNAQQKVLLENSVAPNELWPYGDYLFIAYNSPYANELKIDLGLIPIGTYVFLVLEGDLSDITKTTITFNENYGSSNWFVNHKYIEGWKLELTGAVLSSDVVDKILIELARWSNQSLNPQSIKLRGTRTSASDAAWLKISTNWNLTVEDVFV